MASFGALSGMSAQSVAAHRNRNGEVETSLWQTWCLVMALSPLPPAVHASATRPFCAVAVSPVGAQGDPSDTTSFTSTDWLSVQPREDDAQAYS